jgi:hypothetical protein
MSSPNTFFDHNVSSSSSVIGNACFFSPPICEATKVDGSETIHSFVICLQLYLDTIRRNYKFLNDDAFSQIKNTLNNVMKIKSKDNIGGEKKQALPITEEEHVINIYKNWTDIRRIFGRFIPRPLALLKCIYIPSYLAHRCR